MHPLLMSAISRLCLERDLLLARLREKDVAFFHDFVPPPSGGGHQFLYALWAEFQQRGLRIENNVISHTTRACLFNSFNYDVARLKRFRRPGCKMVHRVDGPISVYRGRDREVDEGIWRVNSDFADATVFQSDYSLKKHLELGLSFRNPVIIPNASASSIFHVPAEDRRPGLNGKIRLITTSWSDNPKKGGAVFKWLDEHLDFDRFEYTFVGRSGVSFANIKLVSPMPAQEVADQLREHDIYVMASQHDCCSNALIEALLCGLPAIYHNSGGNSAIVGKAGLPFLEAEEIPALLESVVSQYAEYQRAIAVPSLASVADRYLSVLGLQ